MQLTITINLDNDAFQTNPNELSDILAKCAAIAEHFPDSSRVKLYDSNGNSVGTLTLKEGE